MPLDAEPNPAGNVELGVDGAIVHAAGQQDMLGAGERWMPHFATCPDGASWSR